MENHTKPKGYHHGSVKGYINGHGEIRYFNVINEIGMGDNTSPP